MFQVCLSGRALTIWVNRHLTGGRAVAVSSVLSTWQVFRKMSIICIRANGPTRRFFTFSRTGTGKRDEVELFLNGESLGVKSKPDDAFHVCWRVPFTPGTLKAVSRKDGKEVLTREIRTAGEPARIMLIPDRSALHADGTDLSFVTVEIQDKDGNLVPDADNLLRFTVEGDGFIAGTDNGDQNDPVSLKKPERHAFYGKAMAVVQNTGKAGTIRLKATAEGLPDAIVEIKVGE